MGAKKISQLPSIATPSLSGMTVVVDSGTTYNMTLENLRHVMEDVDIIDVTYSQLLNLINTSGLTPMYHYKITDFRTTHWMFNGEGVECNGGVPLVGPIEPLIVFATTVKDIDNIAYSTIYHNDEIEYNWDVNDFILDDCFNTVPDFRGVITYRREVNHNNSAGWDIRAVKFRRWESVAPEWDSGTTYNEKDIVIHDNIIFFSLSTNTNKEPSLITSANDWSQLLNMRNNIYWNSNSNGIIFSDVFIPSGPLYYDFYTMEMDALESFNNVITQTPLTNFVSGSTRLSNIILLGVSNNTNFKEDCQIITVGTASSKLDFRAGISRMIVGKNCKNILIRSNCNRLMFSDSVFNVDFNASCNNILLGRNSNDITLKIGCRNIYMAFACKSIVIGPNSYLVTIGSNCSKISIASDSNNINIIRGSSSILIGDNCFNIYIDFSTNLVYNNGAHDIILPLNSNNNRFESYTEGDFTLSTHVIQGYNCVIFKNAGDIVRLRYYDANDIVQIVPINV